MQLSNSFKISEIIQKEKKYIYASNPFLLTSSPFSHYLYTLLRRAYALPNQPTSGMPPLEVHYAFGP